MNRFIYSIAVFLLSQLLLSCNSCGCKRSDNHINSHFDIQGMHVGFVDKAVYSNGYNTDTSINNFTIEQDSIIVESDKLSLLVLFKINYVAQNKFNFSLINSAYACSPIEIGQNGSTEAIDSFYITPIGRVIAFDSSITLDTFFTLNNHVSSVVFVRNDTTFTGTPSNNGGIGTNGNDDFISNTKIYFNTLFSFLRITSPGFVKFRVVLKFKNGERYEQLTKYVKII